MGWDIAIWGTLKMDPSAQEAWRKTVVDGRGWKDWKTWFKNASPGKPRKVAEALASWAKRTAKGEELLEAKEGKQGVEVIGHISKGAFIEEARDIAALFRCAEKVGATGSITFAGVGLSEAYRLELTASGSTLKVLDGDLEDSPEVRRICRIAVERADAAEAAKAAKKAAKKGATKASPAEVQAAPADELSLRVGAINALCGNKSDEAVKTLLAAFDEAAGSVHRKGVGYDSPLRRAAERALVATGRQDVFADVLSRLTDKACEMKTEPTGQHLAPEKKAYEKHDYIEGITYVLGHAKYRPAWDRLVEVVRKSPIISLRLLAIEALVRMAEPSEIEGALGEKADAFHARAFGLGVFNPTKPEEVGKKLIAYVKKQKRSS